MTQSAFDDPDTEGAARAAQMLAMSATVLEAVARLHAQRAADRADADERLAAAARAERLADHAAARVGWSPALEDAWLRRATTIDLGAAWTAATPWAPTDPEAADVVRRVESRLHELHPDAMAAYQSARARGAPPGEAMREAADCFTSRPALGHADSARREPAEPAPQVPRPPDVIAADAYPYPTSDGVAKAARGDVHVITTAPARRATTAQRVHR